MTSYKNLLQEYCQKNHIELPKYTSESVNLLWGATVTVESRTYSVNIEYKTKVAAEQQVAMLAYQDFNTHNTIIKYNHCENPKYIILLDLENIQPELSYKPDSNYYGYVSKYSTISDKYKNRCNLTIIDSPITDAADHLMTWHASQLVLKYPNATFIVVSRDKFSFVLVILLQLYEINTLHFKSAADFEEW